MNKLIDLIVEETDIEKRQILGEALKSILAVPVFYPNTHIPSKDWISTIALTSTTAYNNLDVHHTGRMSPCSESTMEGGSMDVPSGKAYV
jgi:hypothetical protein